VNPIGRSHPEKKKMPLPFFPYSDPSKSCPIHPPQTHSPPILFLSIVCRGRDVAAPPGPVDVDVLVRRVLLVGLLGLDAEGVGAEVVTLGLEQVGREVLRPVPIEPRQRSREGRGRDAEQSRLGDDVAPAGLRLVDGLVEEIVKEQVLEVGVAVVRRTDLLEEDGADDAATAPHERDRGLVELPVILLGSLLSLF